MALTLDRSLILRTASALALMPFVIAALVLGGWFFIAMIVLAIIIGVKEWAFIARHVQPFPLSEFIAGLFYLAIGFAAYTFMRLELPNGAGLALALILSIWASDSGAYFAGKAIGGPKMAPSISPKKTWAGLVGGLISSTLALLVYALYFGPWVSGFGYDLTIPHGATVLQLAVLGAFLTLSGQAGDLLESYYKRKAGVKDSGTLIPGHGGLLDRIDSLLLAAPFFLIGIKVLGL